MIVEKNIDINVHIKQNSISNIALNIGKNISDNYYGKFSTIDKNAENQYYLVKCTSGSYTLQSSHKIGIDVIKAGIWCVMQYILIHFLISSYGLHLIGGINEVKTIVRLNTFILTKVRVQSINYVALPYRASNKLRGDAIRLIAVYVCYDTRD